MWESHKDIYLFILSYLIQELIVYLFQVLVSNQVYQYFYLMSNYFYNSIIGPKPIRIRASYVNLILGLVAYISKVCTHFMGTIDD